MQKHLIILILLGCVLSASAQKTKSVPVIDIKAALANKKTVKLSKVVNRIDYLNLKTPVIHTMRNGVEQVIVGNKVIVLKSGYYQKLLIFDREGNFIRSFGEIGNNPGDFFRIGGLGTPLSWDLSPDEKTIIVQDQSKIKMFGIDGKFLKSSPLPWKGCKFFFLDNDHIIVKRSIDYMETDGNQLFVYNRKLELTDSLFQVKSAGQMPVPIGQRTFLPEDDFYKLRNKIYIRPFSVDTLFEILPELKIKPILVFDFGDLKPPLKWLTEELYDQYAYVDCLVETPAFFITELMGPLRKDSTDYQYETLIYQKSTGNYYTTKRLVSDPDSAGYYEGIIDDMDRLGFSSYNKHSGYNIVDILPSGSLKKIMKSDSSGLPANNDHRQLGKLRKVMERANKNSLIIRIVYLDKPKRQRKVCRNNIPSHEIIETLNFKPVRTSHEWAKADWLSDITYDPFDDSFWTAKMPKVDTIEHRNRRGEKLPGCFTINEPTNIEGMTVSTVDHTLWLVDNFGGKVMHYDRQGNKLGDGFPLDFKRSGGIFGIAFDQADSTLWLIETEKARIWHYSTTGQMLGNSFDVLHSGCNNGRGLAYDPRDHSLWIVNASPNRMIHINKEGNLLPGSFYFDISLWLPDGVALDYNNSEFWIGDWGMKQPITK